MQNMKAEIVTIGDEILIGQVIDTNSAHIAHCLNGAGIEVVHIASVSDKIQEIKLELDKARQRAALVLVTGGLGPTSDDRTKIAIREYFNSGTRFDEDVYRHLQELLTRRGVKLNERNREQAEVPDNCRIIHNPVGTAPGLWFEQDDAVFLFMPGVPFEMKAIMENAMPEIKKRFPGSMILHKTILTQGVPESMLAKKIEHWEAALPPEIALAYLPSPGMVRLRMTAIGSAGDHIQSLMDNHLNQLKEIIAEDIFGYDEDSLEQIVGNLLKERNEWLAVAESCTGGSIASLLTSVPGSSAYFRGGVIAYSNDLKINQLHVPAGLIQTNGAVSAEVVVAMTAGIMELAEAGYAIATSGIAGPDGGSATKPVGTVWIGIGSPTGITSHLFTLGDERNRNIRRASLSALNLLRKAILANKR